MRSLGAERSLRVRGRGDGETRERERPGWAMERALRNRKPVDYSQFDDDEDFTCTAAPPSKKSRVTEMKGERKKPVKKSQKEETVSEHPPRVERIPLDEKLYRRDLEVALALSVQERAEETPATQASPETVVEECPSPEDGSMDDLPPLSSCSVDGSVLGLDKITDVPDDHKNGRRQRTSTSRALSEPRKQPVDESSDEEEPDSASNEASESESNFSEEDKEFSLKREKKAKGNMKADSKLKVTVEEKKKKSPKSRRKATVTPIASAPLSVKTKSLPPAKKTPASPEAAGRPLQTLNPLSGTRQTMWTPPGLSGNSSNSLGRVTVKSPNQGLRLGLSRFARVKPLHPSAASS
ncbi:RAD51-associated protein 1 isoform X1 [Rhinatrema bivittatum]|uniref:RAD51-associated protein 1 isoform X1 n=1 Tax=Rhinatrema bivittatum TaxID=194408 RepID=UPI0011268D69|nr:RAD51-associated protein 1 isoform X1 [Rhinatrema bivittatum]